MQNVASLLGGSVRPHENVKGVYEIHFTDNSVVMIECKQAIASSRFSRQSGQRRSVFCLDTIVVIRGKGKGNGTKIVESIKTICDKNKIDFQVSPVIEDSFAYWSSFSWLLYDGKHGDFHSFLYQPSL